MTEVRRLITRLLDATPLPPGDAGVDGLLAAFGTTVAERAAIISEIVPPITLSEMDRPLLIELERRQGAWQDALDAALRRVGAQRMATAQLRAYAGAG